MEEFDIGLEFEIIKVEPKSHKMLMWKKWWYFSLPGMSRWVSNGNLYQKFVRRLVLPIERLVRKIIKKPPEEMPYIFSRDVFEGSRLVQKLTKEQEDRILGVKK